MKETPSWYRFLWLAGMGIFKFMFNLEIEGREKVPPEGGVVLAANHRSYLDPVVLALVSPRKMNFMAKEELFNNPLFGYLISRLGAFPLRRDRIDRRAYQKALMVLREGRILALFPEGTRSLSGRLGDLKEGSVKIGKVLPPGAKIIKPGKIKVKVGDPISPYNSGKKKKASEVLQRLKEEMIKMGAEK